MVDSAGPGWIELDGVVNMRDVGGLPTADGALLHPGRLIRSDNLQDLPPRSVNWLLDRLGVRDVVDLRSHAERDQEPPGPLAAQPRVRIHHHSLYRADSLESGIPEGERLMPWERGPADPVSRLTAQDHDEHWADHYLGYLDERPDSILAALRVVAHSPGAVIVHCAAGKDRTGTIVGLALVLAGVSAEAVAQDYAASAERVPLILARLMTRPHYARNLAGQTVAQQAPRAETMRRLLRVLDREHGGVEGWLQARGWTNADSRALRHRLRG